MRWVGEVFDGLGVTGQDREPAFPDGAAFRIEIPSVEGPRVLEAVLRAAEAEGITVNRVSQGSGAMLLRASELRDMAQAGLDAGIEVCLFVGPRSGSASARTPGPRTGGRTGTRCGACASCPTRWRTCCGRPRKGSAASWSPTWGCSGR